MSAGLIALVGLIYLVVAWGEWRSGHVGLAIAFLGYAFSNIGFIVATWGH